MELGNTVIRGMGKAANRCQPNTSEDAEHYFPYQGLRQASLLPTRAEPMDRDSKTPRSFVQLCKTSLGPYFWCQNPQQSSVNTWCPWRGSGARSYWLLLRKKARVAWSERSLRFVVHRARGAQYKCVVHCPLLSFHTDDLPLITAHAVEKSSLSCLVARQ